MFDTNIIRNRKLTEALVRQAEINEFKALVLTVDAPILGKREADERQKFALPPNLKLEVFEEVAKQHGFKLDSVSSDYGSGLLQFFASQIDPSLNWEDIRWLKSITKMPIVLKGIQCAADAHLARQYGVAAVWVTNHGGRQLDTVRASVEMLPEIVEALQGSDVEVYVDGGIRQGTDIFKCLALGAKCVFFGRPVLYSTVIAQREGFEQLCDILEKELRQTMALAGVCKIKDINKQYLVRHTIPKL